MSLGKPDEAISDFQAALALDPADTDAVFDIGVVDQRAWAGTLRRPRPMTAPSSSIPEFTSALYNLAVLTTTRSPQTAMNLYRQVLRIKPGDPNSEFNLGLLLVQSGQKAAGEQLLHAAVLADPSFSARIPAGITVPSRSQAMRIVGVLRS